MRWTTIPLTWMTIQQAMTAQQLVEYFGLISIPQPDFLPKVKVFEASSEKIAKVFAHRLYVLTDFEVTVDAQQVKFII